MKTIAEPPVVPDACPHCREKIAEGAKKCPHCHEWIAGPRKNLMFLFFALIFLSFIPSLFLSTCSAWRVAEIKPTAERPVPIIPARPQAIEFSPEAGLQIIEERLAVDNRRWRIVGKVGNRGRHAWQFVKLQAVLRDTQGQVYGVEEKYVSGSLRPEEEADFEIRGFLFGRKTVPIDTYTLRVVDARPVDASVP